jgi:hypothetical protein
LSKVFAYGYEFASTKAGERIDKTVDVSEACLHAGEAIGRALFELSYLLLDLSLVHAESISRNWGRRPMALRNLHRILEGWGSFWDLG